MNKVSQYLRSLMLLELGRGLALTFRYLFAQKFTVRYPEERLDHADAFRGMPVLVQREDGEPRCIACGLCEFACPTDCISIVAREIEGEPVARVPEEFDLDLSRCMICGFGLASSRKRLPSSSSR